MVDIKSTKKNAQVICVLFTLTGNISFALAGDVKITPKVDTTLYVYETEIGDDEPVSNEAIVFIPSVLTTYSAKRVTASFIIDHSKVEQNGDIEGVNKNYTELKYNSNFSLIENTLNLSLNGAQNYRAISSELYGFTDKVLSPSDLTKYRNNAARLSFLIPNPKHVGFTFQGSFSESKTEESLGRPTGLDNDIIGVTARLYNGNYTKNYNFDLSTHYNKTSRTDFDDFSSSTARGRMGFAIANKFDWIITASSENYDGNRGTFSNGNRLDTTSYGAGLEWKPTSEQAISLTYNQLDEGDTETEFVGVDVNWAFSSRTALKFNYGKRFFGDAYTVDFRHAAKSVRTSLSYSEQITTFGQLSTSQNNSAGLFVCEFGSTALADCFQPDSIDYVLQAGQEFRVPEDIDSDINEEVLLRKSGRFNIGYGKRKLKASVNASYTQTEYLESNRVQTTRSLGLNISYALGRKTDISLNSNISRRQSDSLSGENRNTTTALNFTRSINKKLQATAGVRLLDRESENVSRDITDKRLTLGINYTF